MTDMNKKQLIKASVITGAALWSLSACKPADVFSGGVPTDIGQALTVTNSKAPKSTTTVASVPEYGIHKKVVTITEEYMNSGGKTDIDPPDQLDVIMHMVVPTEMEQASARTRCQHMGSTWITYDPATGVMVCHGVDY